MTQPRLPSFGEQWAASIATLASVYGHDEDTMAQRVYALAEQVHQHYCLSRGLVIHSEARPDQHVATSILMALAGSDWFLVQRSDIKRPIQVTVDEVEAVLDKALEDGRITPEARAAITVVHEDPIGNLTEESPTGDDET